MKISTIIYSIKQGFKSLYKNKAFSLASVGTIVACLFLFGIFYFLMENVKYIVKSAESSVVVTVFFEEGTTDEQKKEIGDLISSKKEWVSGIEYTSGDEAWRKFKEDSDMGDEYDDVYMDDNPLADFDSYEISLVDAASQGDLVEYLETLKEKGVGTITYDSQFADKLSKVQIIVAGVAVTIMILLLAVSVFLISITVLNGITVRTEEIKIMKLIGATDGFVKGPFIVEGIVIGIVGAIIPLIILYYAYNMIMNYFMGHFGHILPTGINFLPSSEMFEVLTPLSLTVGIGIGIVGTWITLFKKLRTIA